MGEEKSQGVVALVSTAGYYNYSDIVERCKEEKSAMCIITNIEDPRNLGAVIRSAAALDIAGIGLCKHNCPGVNPTVLRTSVGATEFMPVATIGNVNNTIEKLKEEGFWIVGAAADGDRNIFDFQWDFPAAVIIGGENKGLPMLVKKNCDFLVKIPIKNVGSLNVSVAASIFFYEIKRALTNRNKQ